MGEPTGFAVSAQQKRLLEASPWNDFRPAATALIRIRGKLAVERLENALARVVARHEILRTHYEPAAEPGGAIQVIAPAGRFQLLAVDSAEAGEPRARGFDLAGAPVLRVRLVRKQPEDYECILTLPAVAADQISLGLLFEEIVTFYEDGEVPPPLIHYADFSGIEDAGGFPTDDADREAGRIPFLERTSAGREERALDPIVREIVIKRAVMNSLRELATARNLEVSQLVAAAFAACVERLAPPEENVEIAWAGDARQEAWGSALVGLYARQVSLAVAGFAGEGLAEAAASWRRRRDEAGLRPVSPRSVPLVQWSSHQPVVRNATGQWELANAESEAIPAVLRVHFLDAESGGLKFCGDPASTSREAVDLLAGYVATLLENAVSSPATPLRALPMVEEAAEVSDVPPESTGRGGEERFQGIAELIAATADQRGQALALSSAGESLSYGEMERRAGIFAGRLEALAAGEEAYVALAMPCSIEFVIAVLGCLKAGYAYVPINPADPVERIRGILEQARPRYFIGDEALVSAVGYATGGRLDERGIPLERWVEIHPEQVAYAIFTSGSTGAPKGVQITHRALAGYLQWAARAYAPGSEGKALLHSSPSVDLTITSVFLPLLTGGHLRTGVRAFEPEDLARELASGGRWGLVKMTPSYLLALRPILEAGNHRPEVNSLVLGGEALTAAHLDCARACFENVTVFNEYGPTETTVGCSMAVCEAAIRPPNIGTAAAGALLKVLDRHGNAVPPDVPAELFIGGDGVARGYLNDPRLTAEKFLPAASSRRPGARHYASGDRVRRFKTGEFDYLGRLDDQIKLRGYRIEPAEIEAAAVAEGHASQAVVMLLEAATGPQLALAFVGGGSSEAVRASLASRLPGYMVPALIAEFPSFSLSSSGKAAREEIRAALRERLARVGALKPATATEEALLEVWQECLKRTDIGVEDNFFSAGGDSIRSIQICYRAKKRGLHFTVEDVFRHQTVRELARVAARESAGDKPAAEEAFALISAADRAKLPPTVGDAYPISRLQGGTLFHSQLQEQRGIYHNLNSFTLQAAFSEKPLREALQRLVDRHPILRTAYELARYGEPLQCVYTGVRAPLEILDWREIPSSEQPARFARWMREEAANGFRWDTAPLFRIFVHRLSDEVWHFVLSKHHSILDGWSAAVMLSELFTDYLAGSQTGVPVPREPLKATYRDFVALEKAAVARPESRDFWRRELEIMAPAAPWMRRGRKASGEKRDAPLVAELSADLSASLHAVEACAGVSMKSLMLAVHMAVLKLVTGSSVVTTGLVASGRPEQEDGDRVLGLFLNSLPLTLSLPEEQTWTGLARALQEREAHILPHRRYPFVELRKLSGRDPLFDALFYFTHFHVYEGFRDSRRLKVLGHETIEETEMPLTAAFGVDPMTRRIRLRLHHDPARIDRAGARLILDYYQKALEQLAGRPGERIDLSGLVSRPQRHQLLHEWSGAAALSEAKEAASEAGRAGESWTAVICGERRISSAELEMRSDALARFLRSRGVGPECFVPLAMKRPADCVVAIRGILKAGAAYVPLAAELPEDRVRRIIRQVGGTLVLSDFAPPWKGAGDAPVVDYEEALEAGGKIEARPVKPRHTPRQPAYALFTSGSTGEPCAVVVERRGLNHSTQARSQFYRTPPERFLLLSPFHFDSSVAGLFWTLAERGCLVIPTEEERKDLSALAALVAAHRVTHLLTLPTLYRRLLREMTPAQSRSLRLCIVAGEVCSSQVVEAHFAAVPHADLCNEYGPTEATVWCSAWRATRESGTPSIGRPIPGTVLRVVAGGGMAVPAGTIGELRVGGANLARGYLGDPCLTAARFLRAPDGQGSCDQRWFHTGDSVCWRNDGNLDFVGRLDSQLKIRGVRVDPLEVEMHLCAHPDVAAAAVAVCTSRSGAEILVAFYIPRCGTPVLPAEELGRHLESCLPRFMIPDQFVPRERLPATLSGKLDRAALPGELDGVETERPHVSAQVPVEVAVHGIWREVLRVEEISIDTPFSEIGGDSLAAHQVMARLNDLFEVEMPLRLFYEAPTIAGISRVLAETSKNSGVDAEKIAEAWNSLGEVETCQPNA